LENSRLSISCIPFFFLLLMYIMHIYAFSNCLTVLGYSVPFSSFSYFHIIPSSSLTLSSALSCLLMNPAQTFFVSITLAFQHFLFTVS
jgi:hypothetical protein